MRPYIAFLLLFVIANINSALAQLCDTSCLFGGLCGANCVCSWPNCVVKQDGMDVPEHKPEGFLPLDDEDEELALSLSKELSD